MNQLAMIDDLAARRSAAARKAVETRRQRAQGLAPSLQARPSPLHERPPSLHAAAIAAFERETQSDMPDWHRAALALKQALVERPQTLTKKVTRPVAIAAPVWPDYPVDHLSGFKVRNPTIVVTFEGGEIVRAPAVSARDKPVNIGRGLRIAIAFYQARICRRAGLRFSPRYVRQVPAITACICEDTGEIYDADRCTLRTVETREGRTTNRRLT